MSESRARPMRHQGRRFARKSRARLLRSKPHRSSPLGCFGLLIVQQHAPDTASLLSGVDVEMLDAGGPEHDEPEHRSAATATVLGR